MNLKIYNVVGIRYFAKLTEASEGSTKDNFRGSLLPAQIELGKKKNNRRMNNHTLSENSPAP